MVTCTIWTIILANMDFNIKILWTIANEYRDVGNVLQKLYQMVTPMNQLEQIKQEAINRVQNIVTMSVTCTSEEHAESLRNMAEYVFEVAYQAGKEAEIQKLVNEFTKLKEKSETVRDQLYLDGVIVVITDGDTEKYIKA